MAVVRHPQKHFIAGSSAEVIRELERFHEVRHTLHVSVSGR